MTAQPGVLRPIGFRPWEISALFNREVVERHAEEAAFLWTQRAHSVHAPQYALKDLARLDERVEAHVDGLRVAGAIGWEAAAAQLEEGAGEIFAAAVLAFESKDQDRVERVLQISVGEPKLERALISGLGWIADEPAGLALQSLSRLDDPERRRIAIAGFGIRRVDPGILLETAIANENPRLAARALQVAAQLGRVDMLAQIGTRLQDNDEETRFWSAWAAARLGERSSDVIDVLKTFVDPPLPRAELALDMALRVMRFGDAENWRSRLADHPLTRRFAVQGAGILGDPGNIPWLIAEMEDETLSRVAGAAFSMITGADLAYEDLDRDPPARDTDEDSPMFDPDADWRWPDAARVTKWWVHRSAEFVPGVRYLLGKPISDESLLHALRKGKQNQRETAALELAVRHPDRTLFETRARAQEQLRQVSAWNS